MSNCIHLYGDAETPSITFSDLPFKSRPREGADRILRRQVEAAYPQFAEFLRLKGRYDADERFQSDWYRHYRAMFA